jgi:uncharacterized membrane protein
MRALPTWSRAFGVALALLIVNLLWNDPLREASGGGPMAFAVLNLLPSLGATGWIVFGGAPGGR